jgi:beta-1,4-mannosyl-glycoprotein beta-1,4-N-acetylglucosaminyltransferase
MKIFDCFTFFNEVELLEFRLRLLDDSIDYFVIAESNFTHSGKPKPFIFENNIERFSKWKNKIIYLPLNQSIEGLSFDEVKTYTPTNGPWILEQQQRFALSYINNMVEHDDLVIVGDLDEIPDPIVLDSLRATVNAPQLPQPVVCSQLFHYYYMNCQNEGFERLWNGSVIANEKQFKEYNPQGLRDNRNTFPKIKEGGWHFSYLGGIEKIRTKIESFAHSEFNRPDITSDENIIKSLETGKDIFNRPGVSYKLYPLDYYPDNLKTLMKEYPIFVKEI